MSKKEFVGSLKHGKCGGRKQLHNSSSVIPYHCVNENAGLAPHGCADINTYFISIHHRCNCCEECKNICQTTSMARGKDTMNKMYKDIKKLWKDKGV